MKIASTILALLLIGASSVDAFGVHRSSTSARSLSSSLSMVLEKPKEKKLAKIETLKIDSDHLLHPLKEVRKWIRRELSLFWPSRRSKHPRCDEVILSPSDRYMQTT